MLIKILVKILTRKYNVITRKSKLSFKDILFNLEYTHNNITKIDIINKFNKDENEKISRNIFYENSVIVEINYIIVSLV